MQMIDVKLRTRGSNNRKLRESNFIPGTIYGPSVSNTPIMATEREVSKALEESGGVYKVMTKQGPVFVKFDEVQKDPVTRDLIHFSLLELPKGVENEVEVPVGLRGTPVGVRQGGVLVVLKDELALSGTPRAIPNKLMADISKMEIGDKLTVSDLKIPKNVDPVEEDDEVIAICQPPVKTERASETEEKEETLEEAREIMFGTKGLAL